MASEKQTKKGIDKKRYFYVMIATLSKVYRDVRDVKVYRDVIKTKKKTLITYLNPMSLWCFSPDP